MKQRKAIAQKYKRNLKSIMVKILMTKEEWEIHQAMPIDYSKDHHDIAAQINKHNEGAEYHQYELELQQQEEENVRN
tara:strand:- start:130 stop:360 length:231 start_codon:yes stop_codon:yes gene_type:complete